MKFISKLNFISLVIRCWLVCKSLCKQCHEIEQQLRRALYYLGICTLQHVIVTVFLISD